MQAPVLSPQVLALYDSKHDRWGLALWAELEPAGPDIRAAFLNHHFHWDRGAARASDILAERGMPATIAIALVDFRSGCAWVEVTVSAAADTFRFDMEVKDNRFGAIMFAAANPYRLADAVAEEIERRSET